MDQEILLDGCSSSGALSSSGYHHLCPQNAGSSHYWVSPMSGPVVGGEDIWDLDSQSVKTYASGEGYFYANTTSGGGGSSSSSSGLSNHSHHHHIGPIGSHGSQLSNISNHHLDQSPGGGGGICSPYYGSYAHTGDWVSLPPDGSQGLKRPKSYQCEPCDKWFTSSGHLKRHFNTTLHRNALRKGRSPPPSVAAGNSLLPTEAGYPPHQVHNPQQNTQEVYHSGNLPYPGLYYNSSYPVSSPQQQQQSPQTLPPPPPPPPNHSSTSSSASSSSIGGAPPGLPSPIEEPPTLGDYRCSECNKAFNKLSYLKQHNKTFHNGEKPYKCNQCGKRFPVELLYQEHLAKHAGDKPYKCEVCPKQFNHKTDLRRHMCLHTGEKPFSCDVCGKGFIREDRMIKHSETHKKKALGSLTPGCPP